MPVSAPDQCPTSASPGARIGPRNKPATTYTDAAKYAHRIRNTLQRVRNKTTQPPNNPYPAADAPSMIEYRNASNPGYHFTTAMVAKPAAKEERTKTNKKRVAPNTRSMIAPNTAIETRFGIKWYASWCSHA